MAEMKTIKKENSGISIIICTYSRTSSLESVLEKINQQKDIYFKYEIILVIKKTEKELKNNLNNIKNLKIIYQKSNGLSRARNLGISHSNYNIYLFIDDDTVPQSNSYLKTIYDLFSKKNINVLTGKILVPHLKQKHKRYGFLYTEYNHGNYSKYLPLGSFVPGAQLAIRSKIIRKLGKFCENLGRKQNILLSGEDDELSIRLGINEIKVFYSPKLFLEHLVLRKRKKYFFIIKRIYWQGITDSLVTKITNRKKEPYTKYFLKKQYSSNLLNIKNLLHYMIYTIGEIKATTYTEK